MNIGYDFPEELRHIGEGEPLSPLVADHMDSSMRDLLAEVQAAHQPQRTREAYAIETSQAGDGAVVMELINDEAVLFASFVEGSAPHFPPWHDPDLVRWAEERGIPAFLVAKAVAERGTPPHPEIEVIVDRHEDLLGKAAEEGIYGWVERNF